MTQTPMPRIVAVTTCSPDGWMSYGKRMVRHWTKHWPVKLVLYTQGFKAPPGVLPRDILAIEWLREFIARGQPEPRSYRHDAIRFAYKTAAVIETALACQESDDWLVWCDADTFTHSAVPQTFVEGLLPRQDQYVAWLNRERNYPETGFYVLNLRHPAHQLAMNAWKHLYTSGELFRDLREWHDAWVMQWLVGELDLPWKSLSGTGARTNHPFINGPLGTVMDHFKGDRKTSCRSPKRERVVKDNVPYWSQS